MDRSLMFQVSCSLLGLALVLFSFPDYASLHQTFENTSGAVFPGSVFVKEALQRATELTDAAYAHTNERGKKSLSEGTLKSSDLLAHFKHTEARTRTHIRAAELLDNTVELIREMVYTHTMVQPNAHELLSEADVENLLQLTGCSAELQRPSCQSDCQSERYRSITGECNSRQHPRWGAANIPYSRWLPPEYEDIWGKPRGWDPVQTYHNVSLPPVRLVSQEVLFTHNDNISLDSTLSHLLVEWGQWIDHDVVLTPQSPSTAAFKTGADCTHTCSRETPCFPIQIPLSDRRHGIQSCMPFFRSAPSCGAGVLPHRHREQLNAITSFVDASMVYGSSTGVASALRNHSSPLGSMAINTQHSDQGLPYMPFLPPQKSHLDPCGPRNATTSGTSDRAMHRENNTSCFQAGDSRANEHLGMIALHTLFLREHNRLVDELHLLNPHWSPDTLYQEARKIIGAVHQILTWDHYLPQVLGDVAMSRLMPPYDGYNPDMDPSIANVFAAAAFRFAHVTVQPVVSRLGPGYTTNSQHPPLPLHHSLFASWRVVQEGGIDPVLRGLLLSPAKLQTPGQMMVEELTERLFQAQGGMPLDLGALNLQRGRDHGLPGYGSWRSFCGLSVPNSTADLAEILDSSVLAHKFQLLYGTPHNIDVWVGAISEPTLPGGRVGPLLACLLARQFRALRDGDRFWWEREGVFTSSQRRHLRPVSLSRIICDNSHITSVPADPFSRTGSPEDMLPCSHPLIPRLDLSPWKEPDTDTSCGPIPRIQFGYSLLCDSVIVYQCHLGFKLLGPSSVSCDTNSHQWNSTPPICQDINECEEQNSPCPQSHECFNTGGSFVCSEPSSLSAAATVAAVIVVIGGVALLAMILICYQRRFPRKEEFTSPGRCQEKS
ncbi:eosinophil peroxidase-like [Solea senegalensis]|uniref:Eosinophil peroxidase-like n=2 Tax=Solea senegalensis TaxID=28829 RepID=A0AAV6T0A3_SOLSE|nr:eosinophil peroxidase [Solea senegalensis]KAG7522765.1 eosinophil peroxidase-like [Solea senegalensis]